MMVIYLSTGTLTSIESFLTVSTGPEVSNFFSNLYEVFSLIVLLFIYYLFFFVRVDASMMGHGSQLCMDLLTARSFRVLGGSLITNPSLWLALSLNAGLYFSILKFTNSCLANTSWALNIVVCVSMCIFRGALFYSNEIQQYTVPFMGSDPSVVKRTQRFLVENYQATPVSVWLCPSLLYIITVSVHKEHNRTQCFLHS